MKKYTDGKGGVWAFEADGSQDKFISAGLLLITEAQAQAILNPAPTLAQAQAAQIALISAACGAAIITGMPSSALGAAYTYPTKLTDQANLNAAVTAAMIPGNSGNWTAPLICQSALGVWAYVSHSAAQTQKVGQDVFGLISSMLVKNSALAGQVAAATTVAAAQNINWS